MLRVPVLPLVLPSTYSSPVTNNCVVCSCSDACISSYVILPNTQHFLIPFSFHALWRHRGRSKPSLKKEIHPPPPTLSCARPSYNLYVYKKAMLHVANQTVSLWWPCHGSGAQSSVGSAMVQAPSRRNLTAEARFRSRISPREICAAQSATGTDFPPSISIFPVSIIPAMLHNHIPVAG